MILADFPASTAWTAVIAVIGTIVGWLTTRNKDRADVSAVLSSTSLEWIHELRDEADRLAAELDEARTQAERCRLDAQFLRHRGIALETRLRSEGIDPADINGPYGKPLSDN